MTYRVTTEEEHEIDAAFEQRDTARANARRLRAEFGLLQDRLGAALVRESTLIAENKQLMEQISLLQPSAAQAPSTIHCFFVSKPKDEAFGLGGWPTFSARQPKMKP